MVSTFGAKFTGWATLLLFLLFCQQANGVPGDCDGNGFVNISDLTYLIAYLEGGSPPVNYADCDCDGFPGVNIGDAYQIAGYLFDLTGLYTPPGSDLIATASTGIMISGKVDGVTFTKTFILINNPSALGGGLTLPFSFAAGPGEANLNCTNITMGPMFPGIDASFDNVKKTFRLNRLGTIAATANWEVLCQVDFAPEVGGNPGGVVTVRPVTIGRYFPLLIAARAYDGIDYKRMLFPRFFPNTIGTIGDVNCDGMVDISDVVYLVAYIFSGGFKPGDPDGDNIPNCPGL